MARTGVTDIYRGVKSLRVYQRADFTGSTIAGVGSITAAALTAATITATTEFRGTVLTSNAASAVAVKTSGGTQFEVAHVALAVEYIRASGAVSGGTPTLSAQGSSSNVPMNLSSKGTSVVGILNGNGTSADFNAQATGVNFFRFTGSATGNALNMSAQGTDSNVDLGLTPKGTGIITSTAAARILSGTAIPAGGTAGAGYRFSSTANFGVFFGSGAPTLAAAKGSLYLRSDGSGIADRAYINTDGSTTWTAIATAA